MQWLNQRISSGYWVFKIVQLWHLGAKLKSCSLPLIPSSSRKLTITEPPNYDISLKQVHNYIQITVQYKKEHKSIKVYILHSCIQQKTKQFNTDSILKCIDMWTNVTQLYIYSLNVHI